MATGAFPALYLVPTRGSFQPLAIWLQVRFPLSTSYRRAAHFNRLQYSYRCVARSLPRSDARLSFQPLALWLQVRFPLSASFRRASLISTACIIATGAFPALYLAPMRVSLFNCYPSPYMFTASVNLFNIEYIELAIRIE